MSIFGPLELELLAYPAPNTAASVAASVSARVAAQFSSHLLSCTGFTVLRVEMVINEMVEFDARGIDVAAPEVRYIHQLVYPPGPLKRR